MMTPGASVRTRILGCGTEHTRPRSHDHPGLEPPLLPPLGCCRDRDEESLEQHNPSFKGLYLNHGREEYRSEKRAAKGSDLAHEMASLAALGA
jgi:hypothetical protein